MTGWKVEIMKDGNTVIYDSYGGHYGFHPLDLTLEDRMKMIRALTMTKEDQMKAMFGN